MINNLNAYGKKFNERKQMINAEQTDLGVVREIEDNLFTLEIASSDFYDYTNRVMEAAKLGYVTSTDVDKFPWSFNGMQIVVLVKDTRLEVDQDVEVLDKIEEQIKALDKPATPKTRKTKQ